MAAHSCLTALKSLGGALTTVATAALKASLLTEEESEQKSDDEPPINPPFLFKPFHEDGPPTSPNELLHNLHFLFFPPTFSYSKSTIQKKTISWGSNVQEWIQSYIFKIKHIFHKKQFIINAM